MVVLYRMDPVDLPSDHLEPGDYIIEDERGTVARILLGQPMSSADLAAMIAQTEDADVIEIPAA